MSVRVVLPLKSYNMKFCRYFSIVCVLNLGVRIIIIFCIYSFTPAFLYYRVVHKFTTKMDESPLMFQTHKKMITYSINLQKWKKNLCRNIQTWIKFPKWISKWKTKNLPNPKIDENPRNGSYPEKWMRVLKWTKMMTY